MMKKVYVIPALEVEEVQAAQMLAESPNENMNVYSDNPVDGSAALTKEKTKDFIDWETWDDK